MPWTDEDYPNSMKNLDPKIRSKAISIANAILKNGSKEGVAIATGIKKAKEMNKYAGIIEFVKKNPFTLGGAVLGSALGYSQTHHAHTNKKLTKSQRVMNGVAGLIGLGAAGYSVDSMRKLMKDAPFLVDGYKDGNAAKVLKTMNSIDADVAKGGYHRRKLKPMRNKMRIFVSQRLIDGTK